MKKHLIIAACLGVATSMASAQPIRLPPPTTPMPITILQRATAGPAYEVTADSGGGGTARAASGGREAAALQDFRLSFTNGDHKIKNITVLRNNGETQFALHDNDGNDPYVGRARYLPLASDLSVQTTSNNGCHLHCRMPIPVSPDHIVVLAGFSLERLASDRDVLEVAILPHPDHGYIEVEFEQSVSELTIPGRASVQYVLVPKARIAYRAYCWINEVNCSRAPNAADTNAIEGFRCNYRDGQGDGHFLMTIAVSAVAGRPRFEFQDNNTDDFGGCAIWYAGLR